MNKFAHAATPPFRFKRAILATLLTGAALHLASAQATELSATSAFSNIKIGITDLTPNDGAAAGISIQQSFGKAALNTYDGLTQPGDQQWHYFGNMAPFDVSSAASPAQSRAQGSGALSTQSTSAALVIDNLNAFASAETDNRYAITVLPYTTFTVSGHLALSQNASGDLEFAHMHNFFYFSLSDVSYVGGVSHGGGGFSNDLGIGDPSYQKDFSYSFTNDTAGLMKASISFANSSMVFLYGAGQPPAVPEPASYLMLGAGLAVVGALSRRRQRV